MNVNKLSKARLLCNHHEILINCTRSGWFKQNKRKFFEFRDINAKEEPTFFSDTEPNPLSDIEMHGQVRFKKSKEWVKKDKNDEYNLPRLFDAEYLIDAIKADNMQLSYEGLENIRRLSQLKYISLRNVKLFDDWGLDRLSSNQLDAIEILDLSGTSITANALVAVPKFRSLKAIVMDMSNRSIEFQLSCSLLEEVMPHLKILNSADVHDDIHAAEKAKQLNDNSTQDKPTP